MLATIFGSKGGIRTHGVDALQAPALDHSATLLLLVLMVRIELAASYLPSRYSTTVLRQRTFMLPLPACLALLLDGQQRMTQQKLVV